MTWFKKAEKKIPLAENPLLDEIVQKLWDADKIAYHYKESSLAEGEPDALPDPKIQDHVISYHRTGTKEKPVIRTDAFGSTSGRNGQRCGHSTRRAAALTWLQWVNQEPIEYEEDLPGAIVKAKLHGFL